MKAMKAAAVIVGTMLLIGELTVLLRLPPMPSRLIPNNVHLAGADHYNPTCTCGTRPNGEFFAEDPKRCEVLVVNNGIPWCHLKAESGKESR